MESCQILRCCLLHLGKQIQPARIRNHTGTDEAKEDLWTLLLYIPKVIIQQLELLLAISSLSVSGDTVQPLSIISQPNRMEWLSPVEVL